MANLSDIPLIILAGGQSNRMGRPKGLLELDGVPWMLRQIQEYQLLGGAEIVVVIGADVDAYRQMSTSPGASAINWVENKDWHQGPFSSLQIGLEALTPLPKHVFVKPIDVPFATHHVWRNLVANIGTKQAATPRCQLRGGHPILLEHEFCQKILKIDPEAPHARLDVLLRQLGPDLREVVNVLDETICQNINSPEQWRSFLEQRQSFRSP